VTADEKSTNNAGRPEGATLLETNSIDVGRRLEANRVLDHADDALTRVGGLLWKSAYAELAEIVKDFITIDLAALLVSAWQKYDELIDAGIRTYGTAESVSVDFAGRDLGLTQHPTVDVIWQERIVSTIRFEVRTDVHVDALVGVVHAGRLVELTTGSCTVTVSLSGQGDQLLKTVPRTFDPRLVVPLRDGVDLVSARQTESPE
jgi:hypothetical protein